MTLKRLLKNKDIPFYKLKAITTEYNECGGSIFGFVTNNEDEEPIDVFWDCCSDCVGEMASELMEYLHIPHRNY